MGGDRALVPGGGPCSTDRSHGRIRARRCLSWQDPKGAKPTTSHRTATRFELVIKSRPPRPSVSRSHRRCWHGRTGDRVTDRRRFLLTSLACPRRAARRRGAAGGEDRADRLPATAAAGESHRWSGRPSSRAARPWLRRGAQPRDRLPIGAWNVELLPELAAELVELKVDTILAAGPQAVLAAREATPQDDPDRR